LKLHGNLTGLARSEVKRLEALTRRRVPPSRLLTRELAREIAGLARELGRQVGVLLDRSGHVVVALIGTDQEVEIPDLGRQRGGAARLLGLRLVHAHLAGEPLTRDDLTDLQLLRLDAIAAVQAKEDGLPGAVQVAHLIAPNPEGRKYELLEYREPSRVDLDPLALVEVLEDEMARAMTARHELGEGETTLLACLDLPGDADLEDRRRELEELARTAGLRVLEVMEQRRPKPDPRTLLGSGKIQELVLASKQLGVDLIVFDRELSGSQMRNIAELTDQKVIDRTQLILDIFARHACSREGKLQVELAQLRYLLPRLTGKGTAMSRLAGGIGARGPGESKLEMDRRKIRDRIARREKQLALAERSGERRRSRRRKAGIPVVSIVGYTNAGKSSLLNRLTRSSELAEDKLFATLDPRSRRLRLPREREILITDTVGFIRDLPPELQRAFRATLAELEEADLLLHVVDAASPRAEEQMRTVARLLDDLDLGEIPVLHAFNKRDVAARPAEELARRHEGVAISALSGEGLDALARRILDRLGELGCWQGLDLPHLEDEAALLPDRPERPAPA
jgi:GTP-binding protein HflX